MTRTRFALACAVLTAFGLAAVLAVGAARSSLDVTLEAHSAVQDTSTHPPTADITNGLVRASLYLPDPDRGFYRSTRFDWSGVIGRLEFAGHEFYGPWFTRTGAVRDFVYEGDDIVAGPQSAVTGPAGEFPTPQGYADAAPGGTFVKIGVGALRKPVEARYSAYTNYEIVDGGTWTTRVAPDTVEFRQVLNDTASGYGYEYEKRVRLVPGRAAFVMEHRLRNIGRLPIRTLVYNHNFLVLDRRPIGPDLIMTLPFDVRTSTPPDGRVAAIRGNRIEYTSTLADRDTLYFVIEGYGADASDYDLRVEHRAARVGVRITADRPLAQLALWSIRSVSSLEPFVDASTEPGETKTWTYTYEFYEVK